MKKDNVIEFVQPGEFKDHLTEILRHWAQALVLQAVEAEFAAFLESHSDQKLDDGRKRVVRHGHLPIRKVMTGIGPVPVKVPRSRDRKGQGANDAIRFVSQVLPPYIRRSKSLEVALPYLYLKGLSSGDFSQVMPVLLGKDAKKELVGFVDGYRESAQSWRRLNGKNQLSKVISGVKFSDGVEVLENCERIAA